MQVPVRLDRITDRNTELCENPEYGPLLEGIDAGALTRLTAAVAREFRNGMTTRELDAAAAALCVHQATQNPDFDCLAARIHASDLHRRTPADLPGMLAALAAAAPLPVGAQTPPGRVAPELAAVARRAAPALAARLAPARDFRLRLFGWTTLALKYLIRPGPAPPAGVPPLLDPTISERPQHLFMRVALGLLVCQPDGRGHEAPEPLFAARLEAAFRLYDALSLQLVSLATPTLLNAGTTFPQLASCFQLAVGDDLADIFGGVTAAAAVSKLGGGVSVWLHGVRAEGAPIASSGGRSTGVKHLLRLFQETQVYVNQGGNRPGAFAAYLAVDHADVLTFLAVARPKGEEALADVASPRLKYALWVPDLFMEVLAAEMAWDEAKDAARKAGAPTPPAPPGPFYAPEAPPGTWFLFSPDSAPGLHLAWGEEYRALYARYVAEKRYVRVVTAGAVIAEAFKTWAVAGTPYVLFKDAVNRKSNMQHVAPICSSNLCVAGETLVLTDRGHRPIRELAEAGRPVRAWNGAEWSEVRPVLTAPAAPLVRVTVGRRPAPGAGVGDDDGAAVAATLDCTLAHKFYVVPPGGGTAVETRARGLAPGDVLEPPEAWPPGFPRRPEAPLPEVVLKVEHLPGLRPTYCFNEPLRHRGVFNGVLTGQCAEVTIPSWSDFDAPAFARFDPENGRGGETGVCNLGALCLESFVVEDGAGAPPRLDFAGLVEAAGLEVAALDAAIDRTLYPTEACRRSNLRHRPVGVGVMGLADVLARLRLPYGGRPAAALARGVAAAVYFGALRASCRLAREGGAHPSFPGSPLSRGLLAPDLWAAEAAAAAAAGADGPGSDPALGPAWEAEVEAATGGAVAPADWAALRAEAAGGVRNAYVTAYMPTATTSNIVGQNECFEPFTSNIYARETLAGNFVVVNRHLVREMGAAWTDDLRRAVIGAGGSVAGLAGIPPDVQRRYRTARELPATLYTRMVKAMAPFVCQSLSVNFYLAQPNLPKILRFLFENWRAGFKTGLYYIHTQPASGGQQTSVRAGAGAGRDEEGGAEPDPDGAEPDRDGGASSTAFAPERAALAPAPVRVPPPATCGLDGECTSCSV
jgi:ribonucleotide reductase alpha subunit